VIWVNHAGGKIRGFPKKSEEGVVARNEDRLEHLPMRDLFKFRGKTRKGGSGRKGRARTGQARIDCQKGKKRRKKQGGIGDGLSAGLPSSAKNIGGRDLKQRGNTRLDVG